MTSQIALALGVLAATIVRFASELLRVDGAVNGVDGMLEE
jgi:hypothetical protein